MTAWLRLATALALIFITACSSTHDDDNDGDAGDGDANPNLDGPACFARELTAEIASRGVEDVDLLFMVDNSESMRDEQASLRAEFPALILMLTTGDIDDDGVVDFPPVRSLHLGVVSSDLGLPGVDGVPGCQGLGDEGMMRNVASPDIVGCSAQTYNPPFLSFVGDNGDEPAVAATDLACLATLGVDGCTIEQPLESVLKAVWPGADQSVTFVADPAGFGRFGNAGPGFPNGEFIRNDPNEAASLIALVLVTDEEDCSSREMDHLVPASSPNGLDTRCFFESQRGAESNLFQIDRYIQLFKLLRPGQENLVIFAGIVGVPQRLTTPEVLADFDFNQLGQPEAYFDMLLATPELQEMIDDRGTPDVLDDDGMRPSCDRGEDARAFPPRRIVQVAKAFGRNGVIQSICQEDFGPAIREIVRTIGQQLGAPCLPRPIPRSSDGAIDCEMTWELPPQPIGGAPTQCDQRPFLVGRGGISDRGGALCKVVQLAVDVSGAQPASGDGWYYDDFSTTTQQSCTGASKQRIAFTEAATPPASVTVKLSCFQASYYVEPDRDLAPSQPGLEQPELGSPCDMVIRGNQELSGDEACVRRLAIGGEDRSLFCHPSTKACTLSCEEDGDCPERWFCDDRAQTVADADGHSVCSPGTCSAGSTSSANVGDPCLTLLVPENGFDDTVAYVEGNHPFCDGGACLVYHLEGDPREDCPERAIAGDDVLLCAASDEVEQRVYCSCRCNAPSGFAECDCPDGFSCVDVLDNAPREIAGGYCVRNGTVSQ